jgi:uncharacterized protein YecE (DUF72 family)
MNQIRWHVGCSGFHYQEWKEEFYPTGLPQSKWFNFYTEHFNTLELNVTFYRYPTLKMLQGWYAKAPEGFTFSAKVPRSITHFKKLIDTQKMLQDFYGLLQEGLQEKLSCVLFQMPPLFAFSDGALERLLQQADPAFTNVVEFRNETWWTADVQARLQQANIIFSGVSFPRISSDNAVVNTPVAYYRFHGVPVLFYSEYSEEFLEKIFNQLSQHSDIKEAFVYFNNTASVAALHNARYFKKLISGGIHTR